MPNVLDLHFAQIAFLRETTTLPLLDHPDDDSTLTSAGSRDARVRMNNPGLASVGERGPGAAGAQGAR